MQMAWRQVVLPGVILCLVISAAPATALKADGRAARARDDHPIQGVIRLLEGLSNKVVFEGKKEAELYAKFEHWCSTSIQELQTAVAEGKESADSLQSKVEEKTKEAEQLGKKIASLTDEIVSMEAAGKKAGEEREAARRLYAQSKADIVATVEAVDAAIASLIEAQAQTSNLQVQQVQDKVRAALALAGSGVEPQARELVANFLQSSNSTTFSFNFTAQTRPDLLAGGDYKDHVQKYSFKSSTVIELLKELRAKFHAEQVAATKEETNAENAYHLSKLARDNAIKAATLAKDKKSTILGEVQSDLATTTQAYNNVMEDLQADTKTLDSTSNQCEIKKSEWEERSKVREQEVAAMEAAQKILAEVSGVRTDAPENPLPPPSPLSLLQLRSQEDPAHRVASLLRRQAKTSNSKSLEHLAAVLESHSQGPFNEVINMIQKMIFQLMSEQTDEDTHKNWCDLEMNKTLTSQSDKKDRLDELLADLADTQAKMQKTSADIVMGTEMISNINSHIAEATEIRNTGKEENEVAIKDAEDAQTALAQATEIMKQFYQSSGMLPSEGSLLQSPVTLSEEPSTWDSSYTGVMDPTAGGHGILAVLTRASEDFAKMEADTRAQEQSDAQLYDQEMSELKIELSRRTQEVELKGQEKERLASKAKELAETKDIVAKELEAVEKYLADLQPACVTGDSTYELRKGARAAEIAALKEAQSILSNPASAVGAPAPAAPLSFSFLQRRNRSLRA